MTITVTEPYPYYMTEEEFSSQLGLMRQVPVLAVDTEGTINHPFATTWGLSASAFGSSQYFAFNHKYGTNLPRAWLDRLADVVLNHPCLVMHHAKHDLRSIEKLFGRPYLGKFYCTLMMGHWTNENRFNQSLDSLSRAYGGQPKNMSEAMEAIIKAYGWGFVHVLMMLEYAVNDAFITEELFNRVMLEFDAEGFDGELWDIEQKFIRLMAKVEDNGVLIDQELSARELERGLKIMEDLKKQLGFNPGSPVQLGKFLLEDLTQDLQCSSVSSYSKI